MRSYSPEHVQAIIDDKTAAHRAEMRDLERRVTELTEQLEQSDSDLAKECSLNQSARSFPDTLGPNTSSFAIRELKSIGSVHTVREHQEMAQHTIIQFNINDRELRYEYLISEREISGPHALYAIESMYVAMLCQLGNHLGLKYDLHNREAWNRILKESGLSK